jgi:hypothetical protein
VHDAAGGASELRVYDARSMSPRPLARVRTPQRVPYGFHGLFLRREQVAEAMAAAAAAAGAAQPVAAAAAAAR